MNQAYYFAAADSGESADLLSQLGIDLPTLIFQIIAFLILVFVLGKWVYPIFVGIIDKRQADIDAGLKAAEAAKAEASDSEAETRRLLSEARTEASMIISTAKDEASQLLDQAEKKARARADTALEAAHEQIERDIRAARKTLRDDTVELVALATERIVGDAMTAGTDTALIGRAIEAAEATPGERR